MQIARMTAAVLLLAAQFASPQAKPAKPAVAKAPALPKATKPKLLDINSASVPELSTLPGLGTEDLARIVDNRPYWTKSDLVKKKILSAATYTQIKNLVTVKH